jgi:hypothetical protein
MEVTSIRGIIVLILCISGAFGSTAKSFWQEIMNAYVTLDKVKVTP